MAREEFVLNYQPQIDLTSRRIDAVEAQVHWRRPGTNKLVTLQRFMPSAEDSDLIVPIGEWGIAHGLRADQKVARSESRAGTMALNISARQFDRDNIETLIDRVLKENGLDPSWKQAFSSRRLSANLLWHRSKVSFIMPAR